MERALCPVLIGREPELSTLEDALLAANRGEGQVVVLAGDAGMGKTRLATELQRRARRLGMSTLWGGCSEAELALPYLPFLEAIGNYLAGEDVEALRARLGPVRRELAHLFPQLEPEGVAPDVDSTQGRLRLYEAVLALLNLAAHDQGLLLLIEDLHWADSSTRELLDYLTRRLRNARIMVLATHRSDEMHRKHPLLPLIQGWRRSSTATIVELEPLTPEKVAEMVIAIFDLGDEGVQDDTREFLHARTEGNPFVLEEMLKASLDRGDIFKNDSGWTRKALADFKLPDTVRDTILLRLDRLSAEHVEVLRAAAVLGTSFSYEALLAVSGQRESDVRAAVEASVLQQLLTDDPRRPRAGYRFRHALTREAIYDDIIAPVREGLHGRAADALGSNGGTAIEVSQHLLAAGRTAQAVPLCLEAAAKAELEYAHADAAALYERILPHVLDPRERPRILCRLGAACWSAGQPSAGHQYLQAGLADFQQIGGVEEVAHFRLVLGRCAWEMGNSEEALAAFELARAGLEPAGPSRDLALCYVRLAGMRSFALDAAGSAELSRTAVAIAESAGAEDVRVHALTYLGDGLMYSGQADEGISIVDQSFTEAMSLGLYTTALNAAMNVSWGRCLWFRAAEVLERLELFDQIPSSPNKSIIRAQVEGLAAYELGDLTRAAQAFLTVRSAAHELGFHLWEVRGRSSLADCWFGLGRDSDALAVMPRRDELDNLEDRVGWTIGTLRHSMAIGDLAAVEEQASLIFEAGPTWEANSRSRLGSWCMWACIDAAKGESAENAGRIGLGDAVNVPAPIRGSLEGGLAVLAGDLTAAIGHLRGSLAALDAVGYHNDACPLRRRLAGLLLQQDDADGAKAELEKVFAVASRLGMVVERRLAAEELGKLGVLVAEEATVTAAVAGTTGERYVTVLFVDVRGYTAMARRKPPAELADTVATLQRWAGATVEKHQGIVDKFAGDAVMATFNVSGAHVDHAQHALACAMAIRDKAGAMGLPLGAGIATGPAVVGSLSERANVSVVGETTNLASRLQGQAGAGEILLSTETHRRVSDWLGSNGYQATVEKIQLKGFDDPVETWRVASPG